MIDALIAGQLTGDPEQRAGKAETVFVVAKVRTQAGDGESYLVNVIAFDSAVGQSLLRLREGDAVALSGSLTPKVWTDKQGTARAVMDLIAHKILVRELSLGDVELARTFE